MKRVFVSIWLFIFLCLLTKTGIDYSIAEQIDKRSPYYLSFASIGANLLESRLDCWARIKTAENFKDMDLELSKLLELLHLPIDRSSIMYKQEDGKLTLSYQISQKQIDYLIIIQSHNHTTHFIFTAISRQDDIALRHQAALLKQNYQAMTYFQYKGIINARPDREGKMKTIGVICKCLQAQKMDSYETENVVSMAAYSPSLLNQYDQVELAGQIYNLQIAIHNDSNKNQSYVYLGIPLLLNDY